MLYQVEAESPIENPAPKGEMGGFASNKVRDSRGIYDYPGLGLIAALEGVA